MNTSQINLLRGALSYAHPISGSSPEKAQGVIVGVVTALMAAKGYKFSEAIRIVRENLPENCTADRLPDAWRAALTEDEGSG